MSERGAVPRPVVLALLVVLAGCGGSDVADPSDQTSADSTAPTRTDGPAISWAAQGAHDCVPADGAGVELAWDELRNPVVDLGYMTKDQALRWVEGSWYLLFSERVTDEQRIGTLRSEDLLEWTPVEDSPAWASPDLTRAPDGTFVATIQVSDSATADDPDARRLAYRTAPSPAGPWSEPRPLADDLFPGERLIDAAVAWTDAGLFLLFKRGDRDGLQTTELARSPSGELDGPWTSVGAPDLPFTENYQLLPIDGAWHVLATAIPFHQPVLYRLAGPPEDPASWLDWEQVGTFEIPEEDWNRGETDGIDHETANSAHLCDARPVDGHWYLTYAGSTELDSFEGRGRAKIGIARSTDLRTWEVPGG